MGQKRRQVAVRHFRRRFQLFIWPVPVLLPCQGDLLTAEDGLWSAEATESKIRSNEA